jgi:hypothetical protein
MQAYFVGFVFQVNDLIGVSVEDLCESLGTSSKLHFQRQEPESQIGNPKDITEFSQPVCEACPTCSQGKPAAAVWPIKDVHGFVDFSHVVERKAAIKIIWGIVIDQVGEFAHLQHGVDPIAAEHFLQRKEHDASHFIRIMKLGFGMRGIGHGVTSSGSVGDLSGYAILLGVNVHTVFGERRVCLKALWLSTRARPHGMGFDKTTVEFWNGTSCTG